MDISVVIPVYGCRAALFELHRRLTESLLKITDDYEIILVNDCCPQGSWIDIEKICEGDEKVVGINLSRNFGQIRAITAGLDKSRGDAVVVMDCDLQDRPENIPLLYEKLKEGHDVVFSRRQGRVDSGATKLFSKLFYKVYDYFTEGTFDSSINNFSIAKRKVIDAYCSMREHNRAYTMFIKWLGFNEAVIDLPAEERFSGKSSYSFKKKLKMASEIITSQSNKPLIFSVGLGFTMSLVSFIFIIALIIRKFAFHDVTTGWASLIASVFLMGGLILAAIGVVGIYIGNIFNEAKNRPIYVISEILNEKKETEK